MKEGTRNLVELHVAVFLFGLTGLFGKILLLAPVVIVFWRLFYASIALFLILLVMKEKFKLKSARDFWMLILIGVILVVHLVAFFYSIQLSTIAIALLTFSTFPVFATFIEPYFFKEKIKLFDILIALIAFIGIAFIVPSFELRNNFTQGAVCGMISGFFMAVLSVLNKKYVKKYSGLLIAFYQQVVAAIILLPLIIYLHPTIQIKDMFLLVLMGVVFTALSHSLFIRGMIHIKAQLAAVITCLEPVYGIIFAALLLKEIPTVKMIFGGLIILGAVLYATLKSKCEIALS